MSSAVFDAERILGLYDRGAIVSALRAGEQSAPLRQWPGTAGQILAGRVARRLGAPRLGSALLIRAWRRDQVDPDGLYHYATTMCAVRGPWFAQRFLAAHRPPPGASPTQRALLLGVEAHVLGLFRDFDRAEGQLERALALDPGEPWLQVERMGLRIAEDRHADAVSVGEELLRWRPDYPPAIVCLSQALRWLGRHDEAWALVEAAAFRFEEPLLAGELVTLSMEADWLDRAEAALARLEELAVLPERGLPEFVAQVRFHVAYAQQRYDDAARLAEAAGSGALAVRLRDRAGGSRRLLPVPYVRQDHMTCGPATLVAIARSFGQDADHDALAREIGYGGTTDAEHRNWARRTGLCARTFTPDWPTVRGLIDRAWPIAIATVGPLHGHLQALVGYDERLDAVLVRDPSAPMLRTYAKDAFLAASRMSGARATVFAPHEHEAEFLAMSLPDAERYERLEAVHDAIERHRPDVAYAVFLELRDKNPDHPLAIEARLALCMHERDPIGVLACVERLLQQSPRDLRLLQLEVGALARLDRHEARLEFLERASELPEIGPLFRVTLAEELGSDARHARRCRRLLVQALRRMPLHVPALRALADRLERDGDRAQALAALRAAACLLPTDLGLVLAYFRYARSIGSGNEALALLRGRFERYGARSAEPAIAWCASLEQEGRHAEIGAVLDRALTLRPDDADLRLFAANTAVRQDRLADARDLLEGLAGRVAEIDYHACRARLAFADGDLDGALSAWRAVVRSDPWHHEAHREIARIVGATRGRAAALAHLREVSETAPFRRELQALLYERLAPEAIAERETVLRGMLAREPGDSFARRELALLLAGDGRCQEATAEAEHEARLLPNDAGALALLGHVLERAGRPDDADAARRRAIACSVDCRPAVGELLAAETDPDELRDACAMIVDEIVRQPCSGAALPELLDALVTRVHPGEAKALLDRLAARRSDLEGVGLGRVLEALRARDLDGALAAVERACGEHPSAATWRCAIEVRRRRGELAAACTAAIRVLELEPGDTQTVGILAAHAVAAGMGDAAVERIATAARLTPDRVEARIALAGVLLDEHRHDAAADALRAALRLAPLDEAAWALGDRLAAAGCAACERGALLRDVLGARDGDGDAALAFARLAPDAVDTDTRLAVVRRALAREPSRVELRDTEVELLAMAGRIQEAIFACESDPSEPLPLRGRRAWIEAVRGDLDEAIRQMEEVVAAAPEYRWGQWRLCEWAHATGDAARAVASAEALLRIDPGDADAHQALVEGHRLGGDRAGERRALVEFERVAPDLEHVRAWLVELLLVDGDVPGAEAVQRRMQERTPGPLADLCGLMVAAAAPPCDVQPWLERIASAARAPDWVVEQAVARACRVRNWRIAQVVLDGAVVRRGGPAVVAGELARLLWANGDPDGAHDLVCSVRGDPPRFRAAALAGLAAAAAQRDARWTNQLVRAVREEIAADATTWSAVADALAAAGERHEFRRWCGNWRRGDATAACLLAVAAGHAGQGDWRTARAVAERALELPADGSAAMHRLLIAAAGLADGDPGRAADALDGTEPEQGSIAAFLRTALAIAVRAGRVDSRERARLAYGALQDLLREHAEHARHHHARGVVRLCVRVLARRRGGAAGLWWRLRHARR